MAAPPANLRRVVRNRRKPDAVLPGATRPSRLRLWSFALFCAAYASYRKPLLGYISAAYLPLAVIYGLDALNSDAWLPALTGLAVVLLSRQCPLSVRAQAGDMLRNSGLAIGAASSLTALIL